jgi:large subunit ribosomal protein L29
MEAKDLRERATADLLELRELTRRELFQNNMKNHTGRLEDTSLVKKARRDIARIETVLSERVSQGSES